MDVDSDAELLRSLGRKLEKARERAGLKKSYVAKVIGVSASTVGAWETSLGENAPSYISITKLARLYGISLDYLSHLDPKRKGTLTPKEMDDVADYLRCLLSKLSKGA